MKKNMSMLAAIVLSLLICGCGSEIPDLTPEQSTLISEYATHLLVKHSELSDRNLLDDDELEKGIIAEAEERERKLKADEIAQTYLNSEAEMVDGADAKENEVEEEQAVITPSQTIAEFLEEDSFVIDYQSYELCESYPSSETDDFYMAMDATSGNQLCVLKFSVTNVSAEDKEFNMIGKKGNYLLQMPGGESVYAQTTMLLDDISSYKGTVSGNATEQMVLVFEVDDTITQMSDSKLVIKYGDGENVISL